MTKKVGISLSFFAIESNCEKFYTRIFNFIPEIFCTYHTDQLCKVSLYLTGLNSFLNIFETIK